MRDFEGDWEKEWFTYKPDEWARTTHKLYDDAYKAPKNAKLALEVLAAEANELVVLIDGHAAEVQLNGGPQWQEIVLEPQDFQNLAGEALPDWDNVRRLTLSPAERLKPQRGDTRASRIVGKNWRGNRPRFRSLRWHVAGPAPDQSGQSSILDIFPKSLVGSAYETKPDAGSWHQLSTLHDTDIFPAGGLHRLDLGVRTIH